MKNMSSSGISGSSQRVVKSVSHGLFFNPPSRLPVVSTQYEGSPVKGMAFSIPVHHLPAGNMESIEFIVCLEGVIELDHEFFRIVVVHLPRDGLD